MKSLRTLTVAGFLLSVGLSTALAQSITAAEAKNHIGEQETVCGRITANYEAQSNRFEDSLKFIQLDLTETFNVLTRFQDKARVGTLPMTGYFCVKGLINQYAPEDLIIFEPCPKVGVCTYHHSQSIGGAQIVLHHSFDWYIPKSQSATPPRLSNDRHYTNSDGHQVHSPAYSSGCVPAGATALCGDGTYSFSQHRSGTCSHHGGVSKWL
jgi:hypothetical protein